MGVNRGKKFEAIIKEAFEKIPDVSIDRLHDQTTGYSGSSNICDFILYKKPYEYYIECKSIHGNTLSIYSNPKPDKHGILHGFYGNIADKQWEGLQKKVQIPGVEAGVICWWIDRDITLYLPIQLLVSMRADGAKSIRYDLTKAIKLQGRKKKVFFDYDMTLFFKEVEHSGRSKQDSGNSSRYYR